MTLSDFKRKFTVSALLISLATLLLISGYLLVLLKLSAEQWQGFGVIVAGLFVLLFIATHVIHSRLVAPVEAYLRRVRTGEVAGQTVRRAYHALSHLPVRHWISGLVWWSIGGLLVASAMKWRFEAFGSYAFSVMFLASATGGFVSSTFNYFVSKWLYRDLVDELARQIPDVDERRRLAHRLSLRRKLLVSVTGVSLVAVIFAMFLSLVRASESLERYATVVQRAWLEDLAAGVARGERIDRATVAEYGRRLAIASDLVVFDPEARRVIEGPADLLVSEERAWLGTAESGDGTGFDSPNAFAWRRIGAGGPILVAVTPWQTLRGVGGQTSIFFGAAVLLGGLLSLGLAVCLSYDIGRATDDLAQAAARLASGDLRAGLLTETEDELGDLSRAFEVASGSLHSTVSRVSEAANFVEATASQIAEISQTLSAGADQQSEGVQHAVRSVEGMDRQVSGISASAQELNVLVEESSSSILEMGAASDELADTAGVLSGKVDEVSSAIAQLVRSVKEVSFQTGTLSEAAVETSSSMEEMASAMRQIDNIADQTARLSQHVVEAAEGGRAKVHQTIEGMESIRRATASAESVIAGLSSRAQEIGSILDVIDDVADETNLLALNAAIIAAQAGAHGRAFSVVADEIKELADRVLSSTKEIGDLIRAVQAESGNAAGAIAEGSRSVAAGVDLSQQAGAALDEITRASRDSGRHIHEILRSVQEQSKAAGHVARMMDRVSEGVEAIKRATQEQDRGNEAVSRSTVAMREVAQQLHATTEEQSRGGLRIRESIDGVRSAVESINAALQAQSSSGRQVAGFLEEVSASSMANDASSDRLSEATQVLLRQAEALRDDVRRFVLGESLG